MLTLTVVVPNDNSPVVDQTIASIEQQTLSPQAYDVVIVGRDAPGRVRVSERVHHDRSEHRLNPAQARNRGAAQSRAEVVVFLDADCIARPDWLAGLAKRFADPQVNVVGGGVEFGTDNYWAVADNLNMFHEFLASLPSGQRRLLPSLNFAIRRTVFLQVGGFDERYPRAAGEDADLSMRLCQQGQVLWFEPCAVVRHMPPRHRLVDLLRHAYYQGQYSVKVDPRYIGPDGLAWPWRTRAGLLAGAPLLAVGATLRLFLTPAARRYWYTMPAILLAKLAWCLGAARHS